jgi:aryl-alcohol dehydrogenase-like predicted oxidoreductase
VLVFGVNWIDTAPVYGWGHSEEVVAQALKGIFERPYVSIKCFLVWDNQREIGHSLKADSIRQEVEASLRRPQMETIDRYQIHWPNPDAEIEEGWTMLDKLKQEGKVCCIGVFNSDVTQLQRAQAIAPVTMAEPTPYNLTPYNLWFVPAAGKFAKPY